MLVVQGVHATISVDPTGSTATIVLSAKLGGHFRFYGSSLPTSARTEEPSITTTSTFTDGIQKGKAGVIAITFGVPKSNTEGVCIPVLWPDGDQEPKVEHTKPFIPEHNRLGQIDNTGVITVVAKNCSFSTWKQKNPGDPLCVPDGNLLCRYLAGDASEEDVLAAAEAEVEEQSAREELPGLKSRIESFEQDRRAVIARMAQDLIIEFGIEPTNLDIRPLFTAYQYEARARLRKVSAKYDALFLEMLRVERILNEHWWNHPFDSLKKAAREAVTVMRGNR